MHPIERLRRAKGWTQAALAAQLGVSTNSVQGWEKGVLPRPAKVPQLAAVLGIEPSVLIDALDRWRPDSGPDELTPRELRVLALRYGSDDGRRRTLAEAGSDLGVTRERARQIEKRALEKLHRIEAAREAGQVLPALQAQQVEDHSALLTRRRDVGKAAVSPSSG